MPTETQGEHSFDIEVLVSGDAISGYSAGEALTAGQPVTVTGDYEVTGATEGGPAFGIAAFDVASGEQVPIIVADGANEVRIEVSEAVAAGDELTPDASGTFKQRVDANPEFTLAIANQGSAGSGEVVEARLTNQTGVSA